jgi:flagellar export protein FliJ
MRRYRFRLETVQRVRLVQEQLAVADLARHRAAVNAAAGFVADSDELLAQASGAGQVGADVPTTLARVQVIDWRREAVRSARADLDEATAALNAAKLAHQEARRRVLALSQLDERRRAEHRLEAERAEQATIDQSVNDRWGRGRS